MNQLKFIGFMEANSFALIILIIIFLNTIKYSYRYDYEQKIYSALIFSNMAMLIVDIIRLYVDGRSGSLMYIINLVFTTTMIVFTPILPMLWTIYIDYKIFRSKRRIDKRLKYISIPTVVNVIFVILSLLGGINGKDIFHIDSSNIYHRGELYKIMVLMSYSYLIYSFSSLMSNKNRVDESEYRALSLFAIPPFIGGILQSLIFGLKLTWISMALSMLIIFLYVQNNLLHVDVLTGLYNRRNLEKCLRSIFDQNSKSKTIGGVLLDINDFKYINDTFGHDEGDRALSDMGKVLKNGFNKEDYIFRYAGDEFIIVCEVKDFSELEERINNLDRAIDKYNKTSNKPYEISISKGYGIFTSDSEINDELFINKIDNLMYEDKKVYRRRKLTGESIINNQGLK